MDANREAVEKIHKEVLDLPGRSEPGGWYSPEGDCLFYYAEDVPACGVRLTEHVTVYQALDDERPIGVQIKGIRPLLAGSRALTHTVKVYIEKHAEIYLGFILIAALEQDADTPARLEPDKVNRVAGWSIPAESLAEATV